MIFFALNCYILSDSGHLCNSGNVSMLIICKMLIVCKWEFEISAGEDILLNYRTVESSESYLDNIISLTSVQVPKHFHIIKCVRNLLARLISILLFQLADKSNLMRNLHCGSTNKQFPLAIFWGDSKLKTTACHILLCLGTGLRIIFCQQTKYNDSSVKFRRWPLFLWSIQQSEKPWSKELEGGVKDIGLFSYTYTLFFNTISISTSVRNIVNYEKPQCRLQGSQLFRNQFPSWLLQAAPGQARIMLTQMASFAVSMTWK